MGAEVELPPLPPLLEDDGGDTLEELDLPDAEALDELPEGEPEPADVHPTGYKEVPSAFVTLTQLKVH